MMWVGGELVYKTSGNEVTYEWVEGELIVYHEYTPEPSGVTARNNLLTLGVS